MQKYGFVYIWYDRKHKRYYIGCRWGDISSYICSSTWMKRSYKRRPEDFKRRLLTRIDTTYSDLLAEEHRWLQMIKDHELGHRYYNLNNHRFNHWASDENKRLTVGQKISKARKGKPCPGNRGKVRSEKHKQQLSEMWTGVPKGFRGTNETRRKISENSKRNQAERKIGMHGRKHSDATKSQMSKNNAMNNPIYKAKVKAAKQGIRHLKKGDSRKMAVPDTDKWIALLADGYVLA